MCGSCYASKTFPRRLTRNINLYTMSINSLVFCKTWLTNLKALLFFPTISFSRGVSHSFIHPDHDARVEDQPAHFIRRLRAIHL